MSHDSCTWCGNHLSEDIGCVECLPNKIKIIRSTLAEVSKERDAAIATKDHLNANYWKLEKSHSNLESQLQTANERAETAEAKIRELNEQLGKAIGLRVSAEDIVERFQSTPKPEAGER